MAISSCSIGCVSKAAFYFLVKLFGPGNAEAEVGCKRAMLIESEIQNSCFHDTPLSVGLKAMHLTRQSEGVSYLHQCAILLVFVSLVRITKQNAT